MLPKNLTRIIYSSVGEVLWWYFAWENIWKKLDTNKDELSEMFYKIKEKDDLNKSLSLKKKELSLILKCTETTLKELWEEEMQTITWIPWDEANENLKKLKNILNK